MNIAAETPPRSATGVRLESRKQWPDKYRRGSHCFSTMLSNYLADTGFDIGEELSYVIGGGLGLMFYRDNDAFYINARMHDLEHFFARRVGGRLEFVSHPNADAMLVRTEQWLRAGLMPFLYCEARELSVFAGVLPWEKVRPYGEHALPVRSLTTEGDVIGNDYLWANPISLPRADIERATAMPSDGVLDMACPARTFAVGRLVLPVYAPDLRRTLAISIHENSEFFLNPPNNTQGERALKSLERDLSSMPELLDPKSLRVELMSMSTMLEKIGTGGGGGRLLYARGLRRAADELNSEAIGELATEFARLGGRWRFLAKSMRIHAKAAAPHDDWSQLVLTVREIRRDEVRAVQRLREVSGQILADLE